MKYLIKRWFQSMVKCPLGYHDDKPRKGVAPNFCTGCKKQLNPNAYSDYEVHLRSGEVRTVKAVNEFHARSLVMYNGDTSMDAVGRPLHPKLIHEHNIVDVKQKGSAT